MDENEVVVRGLTALIMILSEQSDSGYTHQAAEDQARLYMAGVRDVRIADITLSATTLARQIGH